ncbi:hypothetical protein FHR83_007008 [Actinoplanes campanulatus]|uniref:Uncharacterized protein n=1 Tax=Actinoplanes campanulatus TaxID=113559 RepID=A0A7W5AN20_9ACTN|nr:hypothetical protein [Actinoplanes campanulatus]MBB3099302.1 hypothetical protein [Actinoplanes campanulatus]GGN40565.1 hypothetical protein GCM10010109_69830 [Actinoplanes campanulatus]GID40620.1 hypothetical protein Aca09nite_71260 [Actinoplanes campanulatus]
MTTRESGIEVFGGDIIYAADINSVVASLPKLYVKDNVTSRQSTTTLADDPDLAGIALAVGVYDIELLLFYTVASTTPKIKTRWGFTGTITNSIRVCHGPGSANVGAPDAVTDATFRGYGLTSQDAVYNSSTSTAYTAVTETVYGAEVTVTGNLSLQWAQSVSTASNVNVQPGSTFRIRKIS